MFRNVAGQERDRERADRWEGGGGVVQGTGMRGGVGGFVV